jgi:hypothetical protein
MKTFKDLRPGDFLYYDCNGVKISEIKIDSQDVVFTIRTNNWRSGSNYINYHVPFKYYEKSIYVDNYKRILTSTNDSETLKKATNQKKILEIKAVLREIDYLKQKLDSICT